MQESYFKFMKNDIRVFPAGYSLLSYLTQPCKINLTQ